MRMPLSARSEGGLTLRRFSRLRFVSLICIAQMTILPLLGTGLQAQTANVIIPDGRTGTSLQTSGNVTNITTTTVSGANAFNSFSQFGVGQGNTVNLQVPNGSQNLINIVRDAPAYVNGTLNSYQNGKIGGNVYFADPYGFVVGKTGVVNVGSLNVSTPSKEFTDSIIGASGQINNAAVSSLMNGSFPISPDGNIRILGRINAADGVRLTGQNVFVGGGRSQRERVNHEHAFQIRRLGQFQGPAQRQRHHRPQRIDPYWRGQQRNHLRTADGAQPHHHAEHDHGHCRKQYRARQERQPEHRRHQVGRRRQHHV